MDSSKLYKRALDLIQKGFDYDVELYDESYPPKIKEVFAVVNATNSTVFYNDKEYSLETDATVNNENYIELRAIINNHKMLKIIVHNVFM